MGINLLVLAGRSSSVCEDLLRADRFGRCPEFGTPRSEGACRDIFLSKGDGPVTQSVCLFICELLVGSRLNAKRFAGSFARKRKSCSSRNMRPAATLQLMKNRKLSRVI
jgi:hypothetical protein